MTRIHLSRPIFSPLTNALGAPLAGRKGIGKHLQPGVVAYDNDDGTRTTYLLPLEAIERMRPSAAGKPVVGKAGGFDHVKVKPGAKYDGVATDSFWDGKSGWEAFNFDGMNDETAAACEKGYQTSCAYVPTEVDETPGLWHNVPYDAVIINGEYTHFAIVPNPRYEGAEIELLNSRKEPTAMNKVLKAALSLIPIKDIKEVLNSMEDDEKAKAEAAKKEREEANTAKRSAAQNAYDAAMKNASSDEDREKAKAAFEKSNAEIDSPTPSTATGPVGDLPAKPLGGGDVPPEPGVPGQATAAAGSAGGTNAAPPETPEQAQEREKKKLEAKNAADEDAKKKKEADDKAAAEKKNADDEAKKKADEEKAKKDEDEKKNALKVAADAKAKAEAEAQRTERFNTLRKAAEERGGESGTPFVGVVTSQEKENLGRARYGSQK